MANSSVPVPASSTWAERSRTVRAAVMGLRTVRTLATAQARSVAPSIRATSISFTPACENTAPRPALNRGESSIRCRLASTASRQGPPLACTARPVCAAVSSVRS